MTNSFLWGTIMSSVFLISVIQCMAQSKYFKPDGISDKTEELVNQNAKWTKLKNKESIDGYIRIDSSIYGGEIDCNIKPLKEVDAKTFEVYPGTLYARDRNHIYYPLTKNCIDYTDCGVCYYSEVNVDGAHPKTFRYLDKDYGTDGLQVFYRGRILFGADGSTFTVLEAPENFYFAKDKYHVYVHDEVIKDADPKTFSINLKDKRCDLGNRIWIIGDKNHIWTFTTPDIIEEYKND